MMCPRLCSGFSVKAVEPNGEQGRRHVLDSEEDHSLPGRKGAIVPRYSKFPGRAAMKVPVPNPMQSANASIFE
jgi:hypothetical protein